MQFSTPDFNVSMKQGVFCVFSAIEDMMSHYHFPISTVDLFFLKLDSIE
jgi:hypothetical protein